MVVKGKAATIFLIIFILLTAAIGTVILVSNERKVKDYVRVDAKVINYVRSWDSEDDEWLYREVVEYYVDGERYEATNPVRSNAPKSIGKTIEIAYNPEKPWDCEFTKSKNFFALVLYIMSGIGLIGLIAQIVMNIKNNGNSKYDDDDRMIA